MIEEVSREVIRAFLDPFEGRHRRGKDGLLYPYLCPAGKPTIGLGSLCRDMSEAPIDDEEAERRAQKEIAMILKRLRTLSPVLFSAEARHVLIAIVDFCYNLGVTAYAGSTLRRVVNADWQDTEGISAQLMRWIHGGGRELKGLKRRRAAESLYLLRGTRL